MQFCILFLFIFVSIEAASVGLWARPACSAARKLCLGVLGQRHPLNPHLTIALAQGKDEVAGGDNPNKNSKSGLESKDVMEVSYGPWAKRTSKHAYAQSDTIWLRYGRHEPVEIPITALKSVPQLLENIRSTYPSLNRTRTDGKIILKKRRYGPQIDLNQSFEDLIRDLGKTSPFRPAQVLLQVKGRVAKSKADVHSRAQRQDDIRILVERLIAQKNSKKGKHLLKESMSFSETRWDDFKPIFEPYMKPFNQDTILIADNLLEKIYDDLIQSIEVYGSVLDGKESHRVILIAPLIRALAFKAGVNVCIEKSIQSASLNLKGRFEFVATDNRGKTRCIIEVKQGDMAQGLVQTLLGLEAAVDSQGLQQANGIVTNFKEWIFIRSDKNQILKEECTLAFENNLPTRESLRQLAGKILASFQ